MRPLQRPRNEALADILDQGLLCRDVPVFSVEIIRRLTGPNFQNLIDCFKKHLVAVGVEIAEQLGVRQQSAGAYTEDQTPVEHVIEHRHTGRDGGGMGVWNIQRPVSHPYCSGVGWDATVKSVA